MNSTISAEAICLPLSFFQLNVRFKKTWIQVRGSLSFKLAQEREGRAGKFPEQLRRAAGGGGSKHVLNIHH